MPLKSMMTGLLLPVTPGDSTDIRGALLRSLGYLPSPSLTPITISEIPSCSSGGGILFFEPQFGNDFIPLPSSIALANPINYR